MATYVLVGGAWLGGWAWKHVARELRAQGHAIYPATLTGLGEREHLASPEVNLETHITDVTNVVKYEDLSDVVLVGHSYAGIVVEGAADRIADRLSQVVYLDSGPLGDGMASIDFYPPATREQMQQQVEASGEGWKLPFPGFEQLAESASLAGLGRAERAFMAAKVVAQPFNAYLQPLRLTSAYDGAYRRVAVLCTDGGFSMDQIKGLIAAGEPAFQTLAAPDWQFHEIATGHWPMLSTPAELATLLDSLTA
jgi:pimeloyl-ACP methyl ester carboxylesterase